MRTIEELSAGAIVYREDPKSRERRYLVLHYPAGHWDFPKGAVENGETEQEAAKREIFEETGILIDNFIPSFRKKIEYNYRRSDGLSHKQVIFFLAKTDREDVQISFEHSGYDWLDFDQSLRRLTFDNARNVLREAESFLSRQIEGSARSS
jgi:bis(5'-nucleosidyl)-tetraphosphatase